MTEHRTAVALGLFDGVHAGHRAVLEAAARQKERGLEPCAFTFRSQMASRKGAAGYLYPTELKCRLMQDACGITAVETADFAALCGMTGEEFARYILCERLRAGYVCCGRDFRFGAGAKWHTGDLARMGGRYGFAVEIVEDVRMDGMIVSSSAIRERLLRGDLAGAERMLGEPYRIEGIVQHGAQLGRTIGFPTANLHFQPGQLVPRYGVYASRTRTPDGQWHLSVTNIGIKPTVEYRGLPLAETYVDGDPGDLYGRELQVVLTAYLRGEQRFASLEALTAQMRTDLAKCREFSQGCHSLNT